MEAKKEIRKKALARREGLSPGERRRACLILTGRILSHPLFETSEIILGYAAYGSEIETSAILQKALDLGKRVYLPRVEGQEMNFYPVSSLKELQRGYKGIPEPEALGEAFVYSKETAGAVMMLLPGAAFDKKCNRIGYGGGFYDRYLAGKEFLQRRSIAVGYACQLTAEIPTEPRDIRPAQVICV